MLSKLIRRLKREPIVSRVGLAAILNLLVIGGVIDAPVSGELEGGVLALVNVAVLFSARGKVTADADLVQLAAVRRKHGL